MWCINTAMEPQGLSPVWEVNKHDRLAAVQLWPGLTGLDNHQGSRREMSDFSCKYQFPGELCTSEQEQNIHIEK